MSFPCCEDDQGTSTSDLRGSKSIWRAHIEGALFDFAGLEQFGALLVLPCKSSPCTAPCQCLSGKGDHDPNATLGLHLSPLRCEAIGSLGPEVSLDGSGASWTCAGTRGARAPPLRGRIWPPEGLRRITVLLGRYLLQGLGQRSFCGMVPGAHVCVWKLWMGSGHVLARYTGQWKGNFRDGRDPSGSRILGSTLLGRDMSCRPTWPKLRPRYHVFCM